MYSMDGEDDNFPWGDILPSFIVASVGFLSVACYKQYRRYKLNLELINTLESINTFEITKKTGFDEEICQKIIGILKQGADPNCKLENSGITPLMLVVSRRQKGKLFDYLLEHSNINAVDTLGWTLFHHIFRQVAKCPNAFMRKRIANILRNTLKRKNNNPCRDFQYGEDKQKFYEIRNHRKIDIEVLEKLLKYGANPNIADFQYKQIPLFFVVQYGHVDFLRLFLKYDSNVNWYDGCDNTDTILGNSIKYRNLDIVKILCDAGASLVCNKFNLNAFSKILNVNLKNNLNDDLCKKYIEALITHARFDEKVIWNKIIPRKSRKQKLEIIKTIFLVFNRLSNEKKNSCFPKEIIFKIFGYLPPSYWCSELFKNVPNNIQQKYLFTQVQRRVKGLQYILRHCNKKVISEYTNKIYYKSEIEKLRSLLDGTKLEDDYSKFEDAFPDKLNPDSDSDLDLKNNLAFEMYRNCSRLAGEQ